MTKSFAQIKANKSIIKDLRKQTLDRFGRKTFCRGETAFIAPREAGPVHAPTELVGKIVDRDRDSAALWLTLYDNGRDSYLESDLHKLILIEDPVTVVKSRTEIVRWTYEIREWNREARDVGTRRGHVIVQKFTTMDHEG